MPDKNHLKASLLDKSDEQLFEMLSDTTRQKLETEFVREHLDDDDVESGIFGLIRDSKNIDQIGDRLRRAWRNFLDSRDLLNRYRVELERKIEEGG